MYSRLNVNLKGDRCSVPASGKNTLRFGIHWEGPGTTAAWVVTVHGRIAGGPLMATAITYAFGAAGTLSGPHVIPAFDEIVFVVTTTEASGAGTQTACWVRVESLLTAEPAIGSYS